MTSYHLNVLEKARKDARTIALWLKKRRLLAHYDGRMHLKLL